MTLFHQVHSVPPDPILGLLDRFRADPRRDKVNLTVGVYQDETGQTPILDCVRRAEEQRLRRETTKEYLSIAGEPALGELIPELIWPASVGICPLTITTLQTPGGSGALRVVADFFRSESPASTVWISDPSWPNHRGIFESCGLIVRSYRYWDSVSSQLAFADMLHDLEQAQPGDAIVIHGGCHNPTGADLQPEDWKSVGELLKSRQVLPILDVAYQGFAKGITEDAAGVRAVLTTTGEGFVCLSFSKTLGLYRERAGALLAFSDDADSIAKVASRLRQCVRTNYSNPPAHGGAIVATVLAEPSLRGEWEREVSAMRLRLAQQRKRIAQALRELRSPRDYSYLLDQFGMFTLTGLTREQVIRLREEHGIYLVENGRMNVAGLTEANIARVAERFVEVLCTT